MNKYSSQITFLYYDDMEKANLFFETILGLELVMDQGFAKVYETTNNSFIGSVEKREGSIDSSNKGGALFSLTVDDVIPYYEHIKKFDLPYLSEVEVIDNIPLKSFFFKDFEGYDFEIQEFLKKSDKELF